MAKGSLSKKVQNWLDFRGDEDCRPRRVFENWTDITGFYYNFQYNSPRTGYVYIAKFSHRYKVGMSRNPRVRLKEFQGQLFHLMTEAHVIPAQNCLDAEKKLHKILARFAHSPSGNEWFVFSDDMFTKLKKFKCYEDDQFKLTYPSKHYEYVGSFPKHWGKHAYPLPDHLKS